MFWGRLLSNRIVAGSSSKFIQIKTNCMLFYFFSFRYISGICFSVLQSICNFNYNNAHSIYLHFLATVHTWDVHLDSHCVLASVSFKCIKLPKPSPCLKLRAIKLLWLRQKRSAACSSASSASSLASQCAHPTFSQSVSQPVRKPFSQSPLENRMNDELPVTCNFCSRQNTVRLRCLRSRLV